MLNSLQYGLPGNGGVDEGKLETSMSLKIQWTRCLELEVQVTDTGVAVYSGKI